MPKNVAGGATLARRRFTDTHTAIGYSRPLPNHFRTIAPANPIATHSLPAEDAAMEPMRIPFEGVHRTGEAGVLVARIRAVSRERVGGAPRAILRIQIRLEDPGAGASRGMLRRLARDEALRFLDVS
jgi:hypothetical protein